MDILTYILASKAGSKTVQSGPNWFDAGIIKIVEPESEKLFTDLDMAKEIKSPVQSSANALAWFASDCHALFNFDKNMLDHESADGYADRLIKNFKAMVTGGVVSKTMVVSGIYVFSAESDIDNPNMWVCVGFMYMPDKNELHIFNMLNDNRYVKLDLANPRILENQLSACDKTLSIEGKAADAKAVNDALNALAKRISALEM